MKTVSVMLRLAMIACVLFQSFAGSFIGSFSSSLSDEHDSSNELTQFIADTLSVPVAYAQTVTGSNYDLALEKSVLSSTDTNVIYRIDITEVNGIAVSDVVLEDTYNTGLSYVGITSSSSAFQDPEVNIINDTSGNAMNASGDVVYKLMFEHMEVTAGTSEFIELEFSRNDPAGELTNIAEVSACNNPGCSDQFVNTFSQASFKTQGVYTPPPVYDLEIMKAVGDCSTSWESIDWSVSNPNTSSCSNNATSGYQIGDDVYYTIYYKNNSTTGVDYIVITDEFDLRLEYDSIVYSSDEGDISLMDPSYAHFVGYASTGGVFTGDFHNNLAFTDGFSMGPGDEGVVVIKFTIDNGFADGPLENATAIGVATQLQNIGGLFFLEAPYGTGVEAYFTPETDTNNNEDDVQITMPPYDLIIDKIIHAVNGDSNLGTGDIDRGDQVTYRLSFTNDGIAARNDIAVHDLWNTPRDVELIGYEFEPGLSVGFEPGMTGHTFGPDRQTATGENILSYYPIICDAVLNCNETLRWGNITLAGGQTSYIDVTVELPGIQCGGAAEFKNEAYVSLTDNTSSTPAFFKLYDPTLQLPNPIQKYYLNMEMDSTEIQQDNNKDTLMYDLIGDGSGCGGPGSAVPYDLSIKTTVDGGTCDDGNTCDTDLDCNDASECTTKVCPGEEVIFTHTIYNSGSMDKHVYLESTYSGIDLKFNEYVYDDPDRYVCRYDTPAYEKFIYKEFDLPRVDLLDDTYRFSVNETYDLNHYRSTVTGCNIMYDVTSPEYQMYTDNLVTVSNAYADHISSSYDAYKLAGYQEMAAITQALNDARMYVEDNITTIVPGYDSSLVVPHIQECLGAQYYDRKVFDLSENPSDALADANSTANKMATFCTDLANVYSPEFTPCLGLGANGQHSLIEFLDRYNLYMKQDCPLVDMYAHDNVTRFTRQNNCGNLGTYGYPNCEQNNSSRNLTPGVSYLGKLYDYFRVGNSYVTSPFSLPKFSFDKFYPFGSEVYTLNLRQTDEYNVDVIYLGEIPLEITRQEYYDYLGQSSTNCDIPVYRLYNNYPYSYFTDALVGCGADPYCDVRYTKSYVCENPEDGSPTIHFAGKDHFDVPQFDGPDDVTFTSDGFQVVNADINGNVNRLDAPDSHFFAPVNTGSSFRYSMIVDPSAGGKTIQSNGAVMMCEGSSYIDTAACYINGYRNYTVSEIMSGTIITEGNEVSFVGTDYYSNSGSNNESFAQLEVYDVPTCDMTADFTGPATISVNNERIYHLEYCNDGPHPLTGLIIEFDYHDVLKVNSIANSPGVYVDDGTSLVWNNVSLGGGVGVCETIEVTIEPLGPSGGGREMGFEVRRGADAICGAVQCATDKQIVQSNGTSLAPNPVVTDGKAFANVGPYSPGDTVSYTLRFVNSYGTAGELEVYDYFDSDYLEYTGSSVVPDYVDATNGVIKRTKGTLNNGSTDTVTVDFVVKNDVLPGTTITNSSEHKLNISNQCPCGTDPNPDNNTDDEKQIHDLGLIKILPVNDSPYKSGDNVTFQITTINQGELAATGVVITDYIPSGLTLNDNDWTLNGSGDMATYDIGYLDRTGANAFMTVPITFTVNGSALGEVINRAEISEEYAINASGDIITGPSAQDIDSSPDTNPGDFDGIGGEIATVGTGDDAFGGFGTGGRDNALHGTGEIDEDDHDPEMITVAGIDVAILNTLVTTGTVVPGDEVTFKITVFNQGLFDLYDLEVIDYLPSGTTFVNSTGNFPFTLSGSDYLSIIDSIPAGGMEMIEITVQLDADYQGTLLTNNAEVLYADDDNNPATPPITDDDDDLASQDGSSDDVTELLTDNDYDDEAPGTPGTGDNSADEDSYDLAQIPVLQTFDLALEKNIDVIASPAPYELGDTVTFTIDVTNQGTLNATGVVITDYIPTGMTFDSSTDFSMSGAVALATIDMLETGETQTLTITLQIDSNFTGLILTNNVEITSANNALGEMDQDDDLAQINGSADDISEVDTDNDTDDEADGTPGTGDNLADEDSYDPAQVEISSFDLAIQKYIDANATPGPYMQGDNVTFEIVVVNQGNIDATDIDVAEYIPTDMTFVSSPDFTLANTGLATTTINSLAAGMSGTLSITLQIDPSYEGTLITNNAEITKGLNADNLIDTDDDLNTQNGSSDDTSEVGTDNDINDEAMGTPGTGDNVADEDSYDPAQVTVGQVFDIALENSIDTSSTPAPYVPGDKVDFIVTVYNQSTIEATDLVIHNYLPTGTMFVSSPDFALNGADYEATIDSIPAGESVELTLQLMILDTFQGTTITNTTEIVAASNALNLTDQDDDIATIHGSADDTTELPTNNDVDDEAAGTPGTADNPADVDDYDLEQVSVTQTFDIAIMTLIADGGPAVYEAGDDVSFDITVYNQGTLDATDLVITNYIPSDMTFASSPDFTDNAGAYEAMLSTLLAGMSGTFSITLTIDPTYTGDLITNNAEITAASNLLGYTDHDDDIATQDGSSDDTTEVMTNNDIDDEAEGTPGTADNQNDVDDYDPEQVPVMNFDLAVFHTIDTMTTPAPYMQGDEVKFIIEVANQGTIDATDVVITDYLPTGMSFASSMDFVMSGGAYIATISTLAAGETRTLMITLQIDETFQGTELINNVEIIDATNAYNVIDHDNDLAIIDGSSDDASEIPTNNDIDDEGMGTPGTIDNPADIDDYDPERVVVGQIYDLALVKSVDTTATPGPYIPDSTVTFTITVENQGTLDAADIEVTDYIPAGLTLADSNWTDNTDGTATYNMLLAIGDKEQQEISISFTVDGTIFETITNWAEISADDAQSTYGMDDLDSTPNSNPSDDNQPTGAGAPTDDTVDQDGKNGGDEDDHDPASIEPASFDLALTKTLTDSSQVYMQGDEVSFTITVENQGYIDGENIEITDYIPSDMVLNDSDWADNGNGTATYTIATLPEQSSVEINITMTIDPLFQGTEITNRAEISADNGGAYGGDLDSTPDTNMNNDNKPSDAGASGDDVTSQDGKNGGDEDDHDPAKVMVGQIYDLALIETLVGDTVVEPLDSVTFEIEVMNQGTYHADGIEITNYISSGLVLTDTDWINNGDGTATYMLGALQRGESLIIPITFQVQSEGELVNRSEISADDGGQYGGDIDSIPDADITNDMQPVSVGDPTDDIASQDGKNGGDEDDHDPASVLVKGSNGSGGGGNPVVIPEPEPVFETQSEPQIIEEIVEAIEEEPVNIYGTIFFDDEDDDMYGDDIGLEGLTVTLQNAYGEEILRTETNENGDYAFEVLPAGQYCVHYETNTALYPTYVADSNEGGYVDVTTGEGPDSEENGIMKICTIVLDSGEDSIENDFALIEILEDPVNIYGTIFFDDEDDNVYGDDIGIDGMVVILSNNAGKELQRMMTDENGDYAFEVLPAGEYCVHYENTSDYTPDSSLPGVIDPNTGEGPDSVAIGRQRHCSIQLDPGEESIENDFGLIEQEEKINHGSALVLDVLPQILPTTGVNLQR